MPVYPLKKGFLHLWHEHAKELAVFQMKKILPRSKQHSKRIWRDKIDNWLPCWLQSHVHFWYLHFLRICNMQSCRLLPTPGLLILPYYVAYMLVHQIAIKIYYANNAINFFLYCLSGERFHHDVHMLFHK